jgi:hypothetical protein
MTNEIQMTKDETAACWTIRALDFVILLSLVLQHSSFSCGHPG